LVLQPSIFEQLDARETSTLPRFAGRGYEVTTDSFVARRRVLCRRIDLAGDRSSPGWVIALVGMPRGFRISADRIHQSDVEVPIQHAQVAALDQPELAASLHKHLAAAGRR
jgi:hypothetical protein